LLYNPGLVQTVTVNLSSASYPVDIDPGLLDRAGEILQTLTSSRNAFIVTDSNVAAHFHLPLESTLQSGGFRTVSHYLSPGESYKTLDHIAGIYDTLLVHKIDRQGIVIALGGGVVGDMTGFAAATILRGVPFVQIPTTLLAMVDASVGGKTGIDHPRGKNLIGAFHQPRAVLIDPQTLRTLPPRELRSGLAECIKHDIIRDAEHFNRLHEIIPQALALDMSALTDFIAHNIAIKAKVVESDPFEKSERAHLNYGHTFGHAIESVSNYKLAHGECVALGMIAAARMARDLKMLDPKSVDRITETIGLAGLSTGRLAMDPLDVVGAMFYDKKVRSGKIRFVLPDRIGHVVIRDDIPIELAQHTIESLRT